MTHPLTAFREKESLTLERFGELVGVTKAAVWKWEAGAIPGKAEMARIVEATEGRLTPNDFYGVVAVSDENATGEAA